MSNDFEMSLAKREDNKTAAVQTAIGRYMQEVQGMVFMAKQFPRDQYMAWQRIKEACQRKSLAEKAQYAYPRGGEKVSGPSIRLAEVMAQNWGNMSCGVVELEQKFGESTAMAFAWDLETNTRVERIFTVKHEIQLSKGKGGGKKSLSDPRDIYELVANMGARRERACILAVIPKDITDQALEECDKTLEGGNKTPLIDRVKKLLDNFKTFGVTKEMVEKRVGYKMELFTEKDGVELVKVLNSLKDGIGKREDYFDMGSAKPADSELGKEFKEQQEKNGKSEQPGIFTEGDGTNGAKN